MNFKNKNFYYSLLLSSFLVTPNAHALDLNVPLTGSFPVDLLGVTVATPYANVNINANNAIFNGSLTGTQIGVMDNQTLNISSSNINGNLSGLGLGLGGKVNNNITLNLLSGNIGGNVSATTDTTLPVVGGLRTSNNINFSGGNIDGDIIGGTGAVNNSIVITGGSLKDTSNVSGTIYAGSNNAASSLKSTNASVTLKDLVGSGNSFLTSFVEGASNAGTILGSNVTGASELKFDGVSGDFKGGFKDFDKVTISNQSVAGNASNVKLLGNTYAADVWNIDGKLDTNGKLLHTYKTSNLMLNVSATGLLASQFLSDANVVATNAGSIKGIQTSGGKNITLTNTGNMQGNYNGNQVQITNGVGGSLSGITSITSAVPGFLDNSGVLQAQLTLNGSLTLNNKSGGNINNSTITNNQPVLETNNSGTMSDVSFVNTDDTKTINLHNQSGGVIKDGFSIKDGTMNLDNQVGGKIHDAFITSDSATLNIDNKGQIYGSNSLNSLSGGIINLNNNTTGDLTGTLNINTPINNFSNAGTIHDLTVNNKINDQILNNTNLIVGNNIFNSDPTKGFIINNNASGNISGTLDDAGGNLTVYNKAGATIHDLTMKISDDGEVFRIYNAGTMNNTNTINVTNPGGILQLTNQAGGNITGKIINVNGSYIANQKDGTIHDLEFVNSQTNTGIDNHGKIENFTLTNTDPNKFMTIFNLGDNGTNNGTGEITGDVNLNNGKLYIASTGKIDGADFVADNNSQLYIYNTILAPNAPTGVISGTNTFEGKGTSTIEVNNGTTGTITGIFETKNGTTVNNAGLIDGLTTNNSQNVLVVNNTGAGELRNTLTFNNSDDTKVVNLNNSSTDILNGGLTVKEGTLNLNNAVGSTINTYAMTTDSATLNLNNRGTIAGDNSITSENGGTSVLTNYGNATLGGNLTVTDGTMDLINLYNGQIASLDLKADGSTVDVDNTGVIGGNTVIENANGGTVNLNNQLAGTLKDTLTIKGGLGTFANAGTIADLTLENQQAAITLDNTGVFSGTNNFNNAAAGNTININNNTAGVIGGTLNTSLGNVNINNTTGAAINNLVYNGDGSTTAITNTGHIQGTNSLGAQNGGTVTLANNDQGVITGNLSINGGMNSIENNAGGTIGDLNLDANQANFTINNNSGSIIGTNVLNADNEFKIVNNGTGEVSSNFTINAPITTLEQNSSGNFGVNLTANSATNVLNLTNSTILNGTLAGTIGTVNLTNTNTSLLDPTLTFSNSGTISAGLNINNQGNTQVNNSGNVTSTTTINNGGNTTINNTGNMSGNVNDSTSPALAENTCPDKTITVNNSNTISGDFNIQNNILAFNNTASGVVTSNHIDARDLRLNNDGNFTSDVSYLFNIRDHMDVTNSGDIYGRDYAFMLSGDNVTGTVNNTGTIWSQGTTIGYNGDNLPCPNCYPEGTFTLNNSGTIVAVDASTPHLTIPTLDSYAIKAPNMDVTNLAGGVIGGSMDVNNYTQTAGSTWIAFMDKDLTKMSTIHAKEDINIDPGSTLYIYTNNDVKAFTNGQTFKVVTAEGQDEQTINDEIDNYTIQTDSPFANYQMISSGHDGFITFNHVDPTNFETATDLTTANHNATILGSQRLYELFVNRDVNQVQGISSGDSFTTVNKLDFMPIGGTSHQDSKDGHAGYDSDYYGGIGYWEHDFNNNLKGGLGFAYLNNNTDFKDADKSSGRINSYRPFAYINYEHEAWRIDLAAGVAKHKVENNRKYTFNDIRYSAKSKYDADEISGHLNIGYRMMLDNEWIVQPMAGIYAANLKTDTYKEKGVGPMNMHIKSDDYNSVKSMLGMKFKKDFELDSGTMIIPELHLRWYHEMADTKGGVSAYFLAQEQLFNTSGIETPKDIGDVAFRLTTKTGSNFDLFTEAYYQFGSKFYNVGGTVGLQYNF